jgi:hypothetical protein
MMRIRIRFAAVPVVVLALVFPAAGVANPGRPFETVAQAEAIVLNSDWAAKNGITNVSCIGLTDPKPKRNPAGQPTFHRFSCNLSGSYFDVQAVVVLTGNGGFRALPG